MAEAYPQFQSRNVGLVAISTDSVADAAQMAAHAGTRFPVLADPEGKVTRQYGVYNLLGDGVAAPSTFIIGKDGTIEGQQIGKDIADRLSPAQIIQIIDNAQAAATESTAAAEPTPAATVNLGREIARGKNLAQNNGCLGCHTTDGRDQVGPTWSGLYGSVEEIDDGTTVQVGGEYLFESIRSPDARIVEGYGSGIMPSYNLSDEETDAIIAYIQSLQ